MHLHEKSREVCIKTRSTPASLPFKGQVTEQTTVKWSTAWSFLLAVCRPHRRARKHARLVHILVNNTRDKMTDSTLIYTEVSSSIYTRHWLSYALSLHDKSVSNVISSLRATNVSSEVSLNITFDCFPCNVENYFASPVCIVRTTWIVWLHCDVFF